MRTRWDRWAVATRSARSSSHDSRTARQTISCSKGSRGFVAVIACWVLSSSSLGSSWGRTGMMVRAAMPCLRALRRKLAFPSSLFGQVLLCALRRLASICAAVAMGASSPVRIEHGKDGKLNHEEHQEHEGKQEASFGEGLQTPPLGRFVRRGSPDPAARPIVGLKVTRRRSRTGKPTLAADGRVWRPCPNRWLEGRVALTLTQRSASRCAVARHPTGLFVPGFRIVLSLLVMIPAVESLLPLIDALLK